MRRATPLRPSSRPPLQAARPLPPAWALALLLMGTVAACDSGPGTIQLRFDRSAQDPSDHVFPTDLYRATDAPNLIALFSEVQLGELRFLNRLPANAQTGWWAGTSLRVPFTPSGSPDGWVDVETAKEALALFRIDGAQVSEVPLAEHTVSSETNTLTARPAAPVAPGTYGLLVRRAPLRTRGGAKVKPSPDYAIVQSGGDAATDASFGLVDAADDSFSGREETLAYVELTVKSDTGQMQLLQAYVEGKSPVDIAGDDLSLSLTAFVPPETRQIAIGGQTVAPNAQVLAAILNPAPCPEECPPGCDSVCPDACAEACTPCPAGCPDTCPDLRGALPLAGIASMAAGELSTPNFISDPVPDPAALLFNQTIKGRNSQVPFQPENPASLSAAAPFRTIPYVAFFPEQHATPMPVIVGIHGITLNKSTLAAFASAACSAGFALIAIDLYQHGDRQCRISVPEGGVLTKVDPVLAAIGVNFPDPFLNPTMIGRARDKLRQSVVDQLSLIRVLAAADGANPLVDINGDGLPDEFGSIMVVGQSLGGMVATIVAAVSPHIDRAVLNVPGGGIASLVRQSLALAHDVDLLMYATAGAEGIGLMAETNRRLLPGTDEREMYEVVASTVLGAADPLTYAPAVLSGALGGSRPRVLLQFAAGDTVVPNSANRRLAHALAAGAASPDDLPLWVDDEVNQAYFPLNLPVHQLSGGLTASGVSQFPGGHTFLLDGFVPDVTAAAQVQAVTFLAQP